MCYKQENVWSIRKTPGSTSRNGYLEVVCLFKCFSAGLFNVCSAFMNTVTYVCLYLWGCCSIVSSGIFCEVLQWWALKHVCKGLQLWASEHHLCVSLFICTILHLWALEHLFFTIVDFYICEHTNIRGGWVTFVSVIMSLCLPFAGLHILPGALKWALADGTSRDNRSLRICTY